jgi:integrase
MDALLGWALRMIEDLGPDIVDAWTEYQHLNRGVHRDQAAFVGTLGERLPVFLQRARLAGAALPGKPNAGGVTVNYGHVVRLVGIPEAQRAGLSRGQQRMITQAGLPVAADTYLGTITGQVDGRPWRDRPLTISELPTLARLLVAAAFLTVCFLSGMRPGEVLNLRQGCRDTDPETGELLIRGRRGKGFDRNPTSPDHAEPERPWVVVQPVHDAIGLLERLGHSTLLFPASLTSAHTTRPNHSNARSSAAINRDLEDFLAWVNTTFSRPDGEQPIPPDPTKHLHGSRLRRTLAYFIVRRPRGLIAAALQYGHVNTKVTLTYAGNADTSWMDDLAVERLELILEQTEQDAARLADGEHVSGPSADEYRARTARSAQFVGRVVSGVRNVERLLTQTDANIHHGDAMTCVWRTATAACRQTKLAAGLPADDRPDEAQCRSACLNIAYTDRDIDQQRQRLAAWSAEAADPLAPRPLRDRAYVLAERARLIIARHEPVRVGGTDDVQQGT